MPDTLIRFNDKIATVVIDRPPVNALTIESYRQITAVFNELGERQAIHCIVLTGAGTRAFCAGFDFKKFDSASEDEDDPRRPEILRTMFEAIRTCAVPVVAAVNGPAIGAGCVLAAVADIRIAAETASFGLPEIDFGRIGGAAYLAPLVSLGCLRRMAFTGQPLSARQALHEGLVSDVVEPDALESAAMALAGKIGGKSGQALREMKLALARLPELSIVEGYRLEQEHSLRLRAMLAKGVK